MWLAIEGIVGAGKTTTAELVGAGTDLAPVIERSDQHPFLGDYYRDPARFALETELAFMVLQAHQIRTTDVASGFVSDFAPGKNLIFARMACGDADLSWLESVELRLWRDLPSPELTVFLDVPPNACLGRIAERGRAYEQDLTVPDLDRLRDGYVGALDDLGAEVLTLALDGTESPSEVARAVVDAANLKLRSLG